MQGCLGISSEQIQKIISQTSAGEPAILASGFLESPVVTGRFVLCRHELLGIHLLSQIFVHRSVYSANTLEPWLHSSMVNSFTLPIKKGADARDRVELEFFAMNLTALHAVSECLTNKPQVNTSGGDKAVILGCFCGIIHSSYRALHLLYN